MSFLKCVNFQAIEIFGSDFSMIAKLFPKRNRGQIKVQLYNNKNKCLE